LLYVRSTRGHGVLRVRHDGADRPVLSLGYLLGYYGHRDWWQSMSWSKAAPR